MLLSLKGTTYTLGTQDTLAKKTEFNAQWPFRVIYFGISEKPILSAFPVNHYCTYYSIIILVLTQKVVKRNSEKKQLKLGLPTVPNFSGQSRIRLLCPVSRTAQFGTG